MTTDHPDPEQFWRHRRRMAYWSMACMTAALGLALAGVVPEGMIPLVEGICWTFGVVVISYYGGNAAEAFAKRGQ